MYPPETSDERLTETKLRLVLPVRVSSTTATPENGFASRRTAVTASPSWREPELMNVIVFVNDEGTRERSDELRSVITFMQTEMHGRKDTKNQWNRSSGGKVIVPTINVAVTEKELPTDFSERYLPFFVDAIINP
jgi:hypothetical protein